MIIEYLFYYVLSVSRIKCKKNRAHCFAMRKTLPKGKVMFLYMELKLLLRGTDIKFLHIIEYRAVSGVFRTIDPPPSQHWIGLLQYNPSTGTEI